QRGRRLVHHDQLGIAAQCAQDLDLLLVSCAQAADVGVAIQLEPDGRRELGVAPTQLTPILEASLPRLDTQEDVLRNGQRRYGGKLLRDQDDAPRGRVPG